jgi:hypothetical protein
MDGLHFIIVLKVCREMVVIKILEAPNVDVNIQDEKKESALH